MGYLDPLMRWRPRTAASPTTRRMRPLLLAALALAIATMPGCEACDSCDRSTRAGSREEPYRQTPLPGGGVLMTERPIIPEHMRANCDVCPEWCTQADLRPRPLGTVIDSYRRQAAIYADRTRRPPLAKPDSSTHLFIKNSMNSEY